MHNSQEWYFLWTFYFQNLKIFSNLQIGFQDSDHKSRQIVLAENVSGKTECIFTKNSATSLSLGIRVSVFSRLSNFQRQVKNQL